VESTVFVNLTTRAAAATISGIAAPVLLCRLQAALDLTVSFIETSGDDPALLTGTPTFRFALKATATGTPLAFTNTATETADSYVFSITSVDSAALRTAIGDQASLNATAEIEWTIAGVVERVSFPCLIGQAYIRTADSAPDPTSEVADAWLIAQLADRINAGGYLRLVNADGDVFHIGLNTGEPPV
jgi:hypothetical protein